MNDHVRTALEGGVLEITFSRPEKKNALTNPMYRVAREALERAQHDDEVRVVLFGSDGDAFTAGNDMGTFARASAGQAEEPQAGRFIEALAKAEKPLIAAVPDIAIGVGTTMLLHCDLVYVAETARLSVPFVNLALVPEAASSLLLPSRIGHVRAFGLFALGESVTGTQAVALGLANQALPQAEVIGAARAAAVVLAHNHPSGAATPSSADEMVTRTLRSALGLIDVRVLDHFIVTRHQVTSMAELGLL
ncbi:MAG: enoyl-CoA hydratase-related protein [Lysobacteraceae bacterium]